MTQQITLEEFEKGKSNMRRETRRCYCGSELCQGWVAAFQWYDGEPEEPMRPWEMPVDVLGPGEEGPER